MDLRTINRVCQESRRKPIRKKSFGEKLAFLSLVPLRSHLFVGDFGQGTTTSTKDTRPIWSDDIMFQESSAPLFTFYMYRAVSDKVHVSRVNLLTFDCYDCYEFGSRNVNAANLPGVLWYLHNEVVERTPRKFGITNLGRKFHCCEHHIGNPAIELERGFAFDKGQATGPFECGRDKYGPKLCQGERMGSRNFPFPNYKIYYPNAVWWSLPGPCPSKNYTQWTDWCKEREPGGYCNQTPTGQGNCTWTYEDAGEITIDSWLICISTCLSICLSRGPDRGKGWTWWDSKRDRPRHRAGSGASEWLRNGQRMRFCVQSELPEPKCDFKQRKFYEDGPGFKYAHGFHLAVVSKECRTAVRGDACYNDVMWAKNTGIKQHPEWYRGLSPDASFVDFQAYLYRTTPVGHSCPPPC
eukprot:Skav204781  [mRNA]  locus=scaffold763:164870:172611:+ [translate_table: standard]